jgi:hypothetical protein
MGPSSTINRLRRYTNLAAVIGILSQKKITLLDPLKWDDKNDAAFVNLYAKRTKAKSVLALCFTGAEETYHHWRIYSHGNDGVCLLFKQDVLTRQVYEANPNIQFREVEYKLIEEIEREPIATENLPFTKRHAFAGERETRIIYAAMSKNTSSYDVPIRMDAIDGVILSPWLPEPLVRPLKATLRQIVDCNHIRIYKSKLVEFKRWLEAPQHYKIE